MRQILLLPLMVAFVLMAAAAPAFGFIHVTIPADDCAPSAAGVPGDNPRAHAALVAAGVALPAGNVTKAPLSCPAP